jgi:hypothetical protein
VMNCLGVHVPHPSLFVSGILPIYSVASPYNKLCKLLFTDFTTLYAFHLLLSHIPSCYTNLYENM